MYFTYLATIYFDYFSAEIIEFIRKMLNKNYFDKVPEILPSDKLIIK